MAKPDGLPDHDWELNELMRNSDDDPRFNYAAVVPGAAFGENGIGHVRACFATAYDQIIEACDRTERFVQSVKK